MEDANETTEFELIWSCNHPAHQHPTWDGAERCVKPLDPQTEQLNRAVTKLAVSCLRALDSLRPLLPPGHQRWRETHETLNAQLRAQYELAGEPYGNGETAMWKWLLERTQD